MLDHLRFEPTLQIRNSKEIELLFTVGGPFATTTSSDKLLTFSPVHDMCVFAHIPNSPPLQKFLIFLTHTALSLSIELKYWGQSEARPSGKPSQRNLHPRMAAPTAAEGPLIIPPPDCTKFPCLCQRQRLSKEEQEAGIRYGGRLSMSDGQTFLTHHLQSIRRKQAEVLSMLAGREDAIIKRCRKKSKLQWETFLRSHWPYQPTGSFEQTFMDLFCLFKRSTRGKHSTQILQTPQLEYDLLKSDCVLFLGLMYYRSAFPIEEWIVNDNGLVTNSEVWKFVSSSITYIDGVVPLHGADFCRLRPYNDIEVHQNHLIAGSFGLAPSVIIRYCPGLCSSLHDRAIVRP